MSPSEFCLWLRGYFDLRGRVGEGENARQHPLNSQQVDAIFAKLQQVRIESGSAYKDPAPPIHVLDVPKDA